MKDFKISEKKMLFLLVASVATFFFGILYVHAPSTIVLIAAGTVAISLGLLWGVPWDDIQQDIVENITAFVPAILILLSVGMLVGAWIISGTVPLMIYYGLSFVSPAYFLVATLLICTVMSVTMGTSWGTIGTVGIALMGVSVGLGVPVGYTAGAVVTGAIFGDKLSPLSDTTVLAAAVSEVYIFDHIKYMLWTTVPPYLIALAMYAYLGSQNAAGVVEGENYELLLQTLSTTFVMNPLLLLPPITVLVLIWMKKPALPVFAAGIIFAVVLALIFQGATLNSIASALWGGYTKTTGVAIVDKMILRGGLKGMLGTVALLFGAAVFGAPLKTVGILDYLVEKVRSLAKSSKAFQVAAFFIHSFLFMITGSYYVTFSAFGPMVRPMYDGYNLHRANLSRILEDTGTALAPIVPWSVTGAFIAGTLGVPTFQFAFYAPLTYLGMFFAILYIVFNFKIASSSTVITKKGAGRL